MIDAIILAGGLGTRLQAAVPLLPKALAPIQGTPFLQILIDQLNRFPLLSKKILALGHKAEKIVDFAKNDPSLEVSIEDKPLGTGGAILLSLQKSEASTVLVINGDTFFDLDFSAFYAWHREKKASVTLACRYESKDASRYGSLVIDDSKKIVGFEEKKDASKYGLVSGGIYLIEKRMFDPFVLGNCYSLEKDFFPFFINQDMFAFPSSADFIDIGTLESYKEAQSILQSRIP